VVLKSEYPRVLEFTWSTVGDETPRDRPTRVIFELKPLEATVKLRLKHEDLEPTDLVEDGDTYRGLNNGWPAILSNLKSLLETGTTLPPVRI
jgi:uncharacterized protein YndB with AHSA1/START domain